MSQNFSATELQTYANVQIAAEALYGVLDKEVVEVGDPKNPSKRREGNLLPTLKW